MKIAASWRTRQLWFGVFTPPSHPACKAENQRSLFTVVHQRPTFLQSLPSLPICLTNDTRAPGHVPPILWFYSSSSSNPATDRRANANTNLRLRQHTKGQNPTVLPIGRSIKGGSNISTSSALQSERT
jgi:hypothetical protein